MKPSEQRYSDVAIVLHWAIAVLVIYNAAVMLLAPEVIAKRLLGSHMAVGLTVLFLSVLRVLWRLTHRWPALSDHLSTWEKVLARTTHLLFYALILIVPLAGWLMVSASRGGPVSWFGLFDIPALPVKPGGPMLGVYHDLHEYGALSMIGLLVLHIGGALKHSLVGEAPGLSRMWCTPRRSQKG